MTPGAIVEELIQLLPEELELVDQALHALVAMRSSSTEEKAVAAARALARSAVDLVENEETPK